MNVIITMSGCDDSTYIEVDVTADERALLERIAALSVNESAYGCMPTMDVTEGKS